jgi:hypothetical protein
LKKADASEEHAQNGLAPAPSALVFLVTLGAAPPRPLRFLSSFVLDNSITAAWCFEDQSSAYTEAVLQAAIDGGRGYRPGELEVVNVLVVAERRKKIRPVRAAEGLGVSVFQP